MKRQELTAECMPCWTISCLLSNAIINITRTWKCVNLLTHKHECLHTPYHTIHTRVHSNQAITYWLWSHFSFELLHSVFAPEIFHPTDILRDIIHICVLFLNSKVIIKVSILTESETESVCVCVNVARCKITGNCDMQQKECGSLLMWHSKAQTSSIHEYTWNVLHRHLLLLFTL